MYLCPWHAGAAIRTGVGNDQLQTRYGWVAVARLGEDYSSGAKGWDYDEPGRSGPIDCARPRSPELQGGKSFIMYLHPDGSLGSCWTGVRLQGGDHSEIVCDSGGQQCTFGVLFEEGMRNCRTRAI